jgi:chromosome segregation ATPase
MSTPQILQQLEDCQIKLALRQREEKIEKQNVVTLKKEIDMCLFEFLKSEGGAKSERDKMIAQKELNRSMELELEKLIHQKTELTRTIDALVGECELKARDLIRIQSKHKSIMDDVNLKKMSISEASKRCTESVNRLKEFSMLYDVVKNERNKYVNQIQAATQRAAEMKEKIRILSNEIEILRHEIMNKDRELTKKKQENFASYAIRDSAKNDANKLLATYRERRGL